MCVCVCVCVCEWRDYSKCEGMCTYVCVGQSGVHMLSDRVSVCVSKLLVHE